MCKFLTNIPVDDGIHLWMLGVDTSGPASQTDSLFVHIDEIHRSALNSTVHALSPSMMLRHDSWRSIEAIRRFAIRFFIRFN